MREKQQLEDKVQNKKGIKYTCNVIIYKYTIKIIIISFSMLELASAHSYYLEILYKTVYANM